MALTWPVNARVTQTFGSNPSSIQPNGHTGVDFAVSVGTPVLSAGAGTVVFEGWANTLSANNIWWIAPAYAGICIVIDHGNGILSLYGHLNNSYVNKGSKVTQGQKIGASGNTGLSTGPHLHFELLGWPLQPYNGYYGRLDPNKYVSGFWTGSLSPASILAANQRKVGPANVNQRALANTTSKIVRIIQANTIETFTGYVRGETFSGNNIWYKDAQGYTWSGGFTSQSVTGLKDLTPPPPLAANQRKVGPDNVNQRSAANTKAPVVRLIAANTVETFTGYVIGESVSGNNIWYKDAQGYTWSGGFTSQSTAGLINQTPAPAPAPAPAPTPVPTVPVNQRIVGASATNIRSAPSTNSTVLGTYAPNEKILFTNYAIGEKIDNIDIWYKSEKGFVWSGGFTEQIVTGLTLISVPVPAPAPVIEKYTFVPDFDFVEVIPAAVPNFMSGNFPENPQKVVIHQFGTVGVDTIGSTINTFTNPNLENKASAHFVVSGDRIVQMVSLKDRAYHANRIGNDYIGIETDPAQDAKTIASTKKLLAAIKVKYGYEPVKIKHTDVPENNTSCGAAITLSNYNLTVDPVPVPVPVLTEKEKLMLIISKAIDEYLASK